MKIVLKNPLLVGAAVLTLATGGLYGCGDFLDENATPQGALDAGTLANKAGVEGTLIGAYRALDCMPTNQSNWGCAASNWVWGGIAADDAYKGSDSGDQPPINDIESLNWGTGNAELYLNVKWRTAYEGVVRANSALRLLAAVRASSPTEFSVADANGVAGEAIFLRAHYHFEAWRMWGNIPYYREDETDFRKPNEASAAVITDILTDLDSAVKLLANTPRNGQKGRPSAWTAKAYKGRVQVYAGQFAAAVTTLRDVRTNGPYALESSFDKVWSGFQSNTNGPETIWAYQAAANDGEPNGENANFGERLNFPYSGSHFGCCGFNQPSQNLVNFFRVDAAGLPTAFSNPSGWNARDSALTSAQNTLPVDPRLDWTVGRDGVPYKDWGPDSTGTWVRDVGNGGPYTPKKNAHEDASGAESGSGWQNTQLNSVNIHLYRYADLLLLLAEADVETNQLAEALTIVNQIRARAGVTAQGCGTTGRATNHVVALYPTCAGDSRIAVPINDASIRWATYRVGQYPAFPDQAFARAAVRAERRLELAMEGQRFFDLRRYGVADATAAINTYINGIGGGAEKTRRTYKQFAIPFAAKHMLYPIPQTQVDLSKVGGTSTLAQNPGW
jgi:hypothetical protein